MSDPFAVSAIQFSARLYDAVTNRETVEQLIRAEVRDFGSKLIVLPELAISGYGLSPDGLAASSEPLDGPTLAMLSGLSRELGIVIVCGFCEAADDGLYNAAMMVTPDGEPVLYRKLHLFDREKDVFLPGNLGLVLGETPLGAIGLCVCYDLRFVEVARGLSLAGADILAVPTAWVGGFDPVPRDSMGFIGQARGALAQANLDQLPMVCASQSGRNEEVRFLGSSLIADAFGNCLQGPMDENAEGSIRVGMSLESIRAARVRSDRVRPRDDRRMDVYGVRVVRAEHDRIF